MSPFDEIKYLTLLKGHDISIKNFKEISINNSSNRIDSEYFQQKFIKLDLQLGAIPCQKLNKLTKWVTQGPNPDFIEYGIPCLTGRNINKGRVDYHDSDYVSDLEYLKYERFQLSIGDTLVTLKGKGSIGKIGYVTDARRSIFSRDIGIIRPHKINSGYLNAFLLSSFGKLLFERGETGGTGQSTLATSYLKNINIPRLSIEEEIGSLLIESEKFLVKSYEKYKLAEQIIINSLGFDELKLNSDPVNIKSYKQSVAASNRIDSEYYLKKYEQIRDLLKKYPLGFIMLSDIVTTKRGNLISDKFYIDRGEIPYIRGRDISANVLNKSSLIYISNDFIKTSEILCKENDIVFALIGSVGTAALVTQEFDNSFISNNLGLMRIHDKRILPEYLHLYLTIDRIGRQLFSQIEMRTAQPKISDKDTHSFPVPLLELSKQKEIAALVTESFNLSKKSDQFLDIALRTVELAIIQNDEVALTYLKREQFKLVST